MGKNQSLTLLMVLCYACRQVSIVAVSEKLHPAGDSDTDTHSLTVDRIWDFYGIIEGRMAGPDWDRNATGRPTESTKLDPWGFQRLNHQSQCIHRLDLYPLPTHTHTHTADVQFGLHVGPKQLAQELSQKLLPI